MMLPPIHFVLIQEANLVERKENANNYKVVYWYLIALRIVTVLSRYVLIVHTTLT